MNLLVINISESNDFLDILFLNPIHVSVKGKTETP